MLVQGDYYACERCVLVGDPRALATCKHTGTLQNVTKNINEETRRGLEAEGNRFDPIAVGKKCEKGHVHVWPTSGRHVLDIKPCETQCDWCHNHTTNTVSNLRKVSINP
jgi:hypothetical protein